MTRAIIMTRNYQQGWKRNVTENAELIQGYVCIGIDRQKSIFEYHEIIGKLNN